MHQELRIIKDNNRKYVDLYPDSKYRFRIVRPYTSVFMGEVYETGPIDLKKMGVTEAIYSHFLQIVDHVVEHEFEMDGGNPIDSNTFDKIYDRYISDENHNYLLQELNGYEFMLVFEPGSTVLHSLCVLRRDGTRCHVTPILKNLMAHKPNPELCRDICNFIMHRYRYIRQIRFTLRINSMSQMPAIAKCLPNAAEMVYFNLYKYPDAKFSEYGMYFEDNGYSTFKDQNDKYHHDYNLVKLSHMTQHAIDAVLRPVTLSNWKQYMGRFRPKRHEVVIDGVESPDQGLRIDIDKLKRDMISDPHMKISVITPVTDSTKVLGFVSRIVYPDSDTAHLRSHRLVYLHISPQYRKRGIGKAVLKTLDHQIVDANYTYPRISTTIFDPQAAPVEFLIKSGYTLDTCEIPINRR